MVDRSLKKTVQIKVNNYNEIISITDLGLGLNYKKKELKQLIDLIFSGQVKTMMINHKDRLLLFGSELIFYLCQLFKVNVIVIEQTNNQSFEETLSQDVRELMTN